MEKYTFQIVHMGIDVHELFMNVILHVVSSEPGGRYHYIQRYSIENTEERFRHRPFVKQ